mgnify:CR=1 FL=1
MFVNSVCQHSSVLVNSRCACKHAGMFVNIKLYQSGYSSFPPPIGAIEAVNLSFRGVDDCTSTDETPKSW